jgi:hypothetical protein
MAAPPLVTLTLWGVGPLGIPAAVARMGLDRRHLRGVPGLRFAKLLGTGSGRSFTLRDADPLHWGLLAVWDEPAAAQAFATGPTSRRWAGLAREQLDVHLAPLASRGSWAGRAPFGDPVPRRAGGPVAAITRARLRLTTARAFWRSVPPVSAELRTVPGLRLAVGIGEAPVGLQGTFSLWDGADALTEFAHRRPAHVDVVERTRTVGWYAEELFARFEVLQTTGTFGGVEPFAGAGSRGTAAPGTDAPGTGTR